MFRSAHALAVAAVIFATACGTANAAPIAPLDVVQTKPSNVAQVHWYGYHHRYRRDYWYWHTYPYWDGYYLVGWNPCLHYWCGRRWWGWW
jgi:hypothetical protein